MASAWKACSSAVLPIQLLSVPARRAAFRVHASSSPSRLRTRTSGSSSDIAAFRDAKFRGARLASFDKFFLKFGWPRP